HETQSPFNKPVAVPKPNHPQLTILNVIHSPTYSSYQVYHPQFTQKSNHFSQELLKPYKQLPTNPPLKNLHTRLEFASPKAVI
ncbi:adenine nucleotide alpha hydrolase family protein, partial [Staphylococcus epidermidis]